MSRRAVRRATCQAGDTLVEVAMALAILGVVLVTAFHIATVSYAEGQQARERTQAIQLAQDQAEQLRYWRDYTIQQSLINGVAPTTPIFTTVALGSCYTGPCHVEVAANGTPTLHTGPVPNSQPFEGINYTVQIRPYQSAVALVSSSKMQFEVSVQWDAPVQTETVGGRINQNVSKIPLILVDKRGITPRDCSLAGSQIPGNPCD